MKKSSLGTRLLVHGILGAICIATIIPMILSLSVSLTSTQALAAGGYRFFPREFSLMAYEWILRYPQSLITGYSNSIFITLVGTALNLAVTALVAYPLSLKRFKYRELISKYIFFTMIFSGGMVPLYILVVRYLGWKNQLASLIFPALAAPFNIFLMRIFMQEIPESLTESAKLDGASEYQIFLKIIAPLSKPGLATVAMMIALKYWNESFDAILYIDKAPKFPVQLVLNNIVSIVNNIKMSNTMPGSVYTIDPTTVPSDTIMFAMMVLSSLPMVFLFTFFQKYFVKGMVTGAVKG